MLSSQGNQVLLNMLNLVSKITRFYASLIEDSQIDIMWQSLNACQEYTRFEKIAILSIFFASKKLILT
jgi:hypothetical protein